MSRWYAIHVWVAYMDLNSKAGKEILCTFPTKLSVEPSCHSINDKPLKTLPAYTASVVTGVPSEACLGSRDGLPSYEALSGDTPS
jgi:hypothetical protein